MTTDVFGNPLCTAYDYTDANNNGYMDPGEVNLGPAPDYAPTVTHMGGKCLSGDINLDGVVNATDVSLYSDPALDPGMLMIPNLGPNRYALSVVPPTGSSWVQTTTLEGNHDWDSWVMEGSTGYDTEFVVAGEQFPSQIFGFVPGPTQQLSGAGGPDVLAAAYSTASRPEGTARSRASSTRPRSMSRPRAAPACPGRSGAASVARRSITRSTSRGSPSPTSTAAMPPSGSAAAAPTAPSRSQTSPTAATRSRTGTSPRTRSSTCST